MRQIQGTRNRYRGMSLIELMVAITISMIIMAGVLSIFISNKQTYEITDDMSRLQENGRFATEFLIRDLRMAGYFGCADNPGAVFNHVNGASGGGVLDTGEAIEGLEQAATKWKPTDSTDLPLNPTRRAGTDAITIRYLDGGGIGVQTPFMPTTAGTIHVAANNGLVEGDIVAVSDCSSTDIFQITNSNPDADTGSGKASVVHNTGAGSPGNATKDMSKIYEGDASISKVVAVRYYIGNDADGMPNLYRARVSASGGVVAIPPVSQALVPGVENMQILYGEDTSGDGSPDVYRKADDGALNWDNVVSVRFGLLLRTIDEYGNDPDARNYQLFGSAKPGTCSTATEGCVATTSLNVRRRVFNATVLMRNLQ